MKTLAVSGRTRKIPWFLNIDEFKGSASLLDDVILGTKFAKEAINLMQVQDGRWKTRWGTGYLGTGIPGENNIVAAWPFNRSDGTQDIIAICDSGNSYKTSNLGATWSAITGVTFDVTATQYYFEQAENQLLISNGVDRLTRYNGTAMIRYTPMAAPASLTGTRNVLTAGAYSQFYQVTALNEVGETVGSNEFTITTNKPRNQWIQSSSERIDLSWAAVTGAIRYQVYWSDISGDELLLAETSTTTISFQDDGSYVQNPFFSVPTEDSTGAPAFKMVSFSGSRLWGITDEYVWWSGTDPYVGYFSDAFGGGYQPINKGSGEKLVWVGHFRSGKGDPVATVITKNSKGLGSVWQVALEATTIADTTIIVPNPLRLPGPIGTAAPLGVVSANDRLYIPNSTGIFSLNNQEQVTNILATPELSANIRPDIQGLLDIEMQAGIWFDSKVIFTASEGGGENDIMFGLDTERGEWFYKWTIGFKSFLEVSGDLGRNMLVAVPNSGNTLIQISPNIKGDLGQPFYQSWISGLIPVSEDMTVFARLKETEIELGRPVGTIYFETLGVDDKRGFSSLGTRLITDSVSNIDFTAGLWGEYMFGDDDDVPRTFSQASVKKGKKIRRKINSIQFHVYSSSSDTDFTILKLQARGFIEKLKTPASFFR
ncbi:MAG: hypothetical protein AAB519_03840 [Patescibacteria group bacterium]